ncbi:hypothetical protein AMATHDRAFT_1583 [Amanita thiersii Skay4041]|uniref:Uncharacterized protein n=1 Tax=Amanita thiersii Skay4041 TaxID=703135 RepID=A0A2A9NUX0_9AGAR|nr:hypothetical protein AMATHDRAFT_1583 [Amanita thiersii Skay4041]
MLQTPASGQSVYFDASSTLQSPYKTKDQVSAMPYNNGDVVPLNQSHELLGWLPTAEREEDIHQRQQANSLDVNKEPSPSSHRFSPLLSDKINEEPRQSGGKESRRSASTHRPGSIFSKSILIGHEGQLVDGSTFIHGAGTTGPAATVGKNTELSRRASMAETSLTPKQKLRILKHELKGGKRLSRIIKKEGKVEKKALEVAIHELAELQDLQEVSVKYEAKAHTAHAKMLASVRRNESEYLAAKTRYDTAVAQLHADAEVLERVREHAREATEQVQVKAREVDGLRSIYSVDEREREQKLVELTGRKSHLFWK